MNNLGCGTGDQADVNIFGVSSDVSYNVGPGVIDPCYHEGVLVRVGEERVC